MIRRVCLFVVVLFPKPYADQPFDDKVNPFFIRTAIAGFCIYDLIFPLESCLAAPSTQARGSVPERKMGEYLSRIWA